MAQPNAPIPPPGVLEYLAQLAQNGTLSSLSIPQHSPPPTTPIPAEPDIPAPPAQARTFNRVGRGTGGALLEKQRTSKQITASAKKRKSQLDLDAELLLSPGLEAAESTNLKQPKRPKTKGSARQPKKVIPKLTRRSAYATPAPTDPEPIPSPISTPAPPTPIRPVSRAIKPIVKVQSPEPVDLPLADNDIFIPEGQDGGSEQSGEGSDEEAEDGDPPMPVQNQNPKFAGSSINLVQAYLSKLGGATLPVLPVQSSPVVPSPIVYSTGDSTKSTKCIAFYPDGWRKVLTDSKDVIRASILLTTPFPESASARVMINECFHEVSMTLCTDGLVLEPGLSWNDDMLSILLTDISTSRSELKKLAKIFVGVDPSLFPLSEDHKSFLDRSAPEVRTIAARMEKKKKKAKAVSQPLHDSNHVRTSVASRLAQFAFMNNPPTANGKLFANPILERLCKSFYEEEKWQRSLMYQANGDSEWFSSVTVTMVSLAATAYRCALDEWKTGHFVTKIFEGEKYTKFYSDIQDHVIDRIENDPLCEPALDRFSSWATESLFVQDLDAADE